MSEHDDDVEEARQAYGNARYAGPGEMHRAHLFAQKGINLGFVVEDLPSGKEADLIVRYGDDRHAILVAPTRTGKNRDVLSGTLLEDDGTYIVIDTKGQNAAITIDQRRKMHGQNVFVVNPFGLHTQAPFSLPMHRINPLATIDKTSPTFVAQISSLAEVIIIPEGDQPHWADSSRQLISAILMFLIVAFPEYATLGEMRKILALEFRKKKKSELGQEPEESAEAPSDVDEPFWRKKGILLETVLRTMSLCGYPPVVNRVKRFIGNFSDEVQSVLSTGLTQTAFLDDPCIAECLSASDFRFVDFKKERGTVFIVVPATELESYRRFVRLIITSALNEQMSQPIGPAGRVTFLLDEFAAISRGSAMTQVETALGLAAGYGVKLWCVLQNLGQMQEIYEKSWETFIANSGIVQFLTANDMTTSEYVSKRSGVYPITIPSPSWSTGTGTSSGEGKASSSANKGLAISFQWVGRPLLFPMDVISLPPDESIIFVAGMDQVVRIKRQPYYLDARFKDANGNPLYGKDPYHP